MKKFLALTKRNLLEVVRDPLSIIFLVAFPVVMLVFMQLIVKSFEVSPVNFQIKSYAIGICVFGYTFSGMFTAMGVASDKNTAFINRIKISPVKKSTYLLSYLLSGLPLTFLQTVLFLAISFIFGLPFDFNALLILVYLLPSQLFYLTVGISLGTLCKNEKQSGPMSSIIISLSCMLGGVFMPVTTFTGAFKTVIDILPFAHTVQIASEIYNVGAGCILSHLPFVLGYTLALWLVIVLVNLSKRK